MLSGYLHPDYAWSHREFGHPIGLPASGGWLIKRTIGETGLNDAMGCYPLFCCTNWDGLPRDINALSDGLISVVIVTDPLGDYSSQLLRSCFDQVRPFKEHFIIATGRPLRDFVNPSHRRQALRALRDVDVEICVEPLQHIEDWMRLVDVLAARHAIKWRFSRAAFEKQFAVPGLVMFRAAVDRRTVGLDLWYVQGNCAQGHLAAFDSIGYELRASYATKWRMIEYFSDKVLKINLGAGAGVASDGTDGLSYFKQGWSTGRRTAWLCGRVIERTSYAKLTQLYGVAENNYFPTYRRGEF